MLSLRNPALPLHHVPDLQDVKFKPESIVAYLAALGDERNKREEQMLIRFLSASRMRALSDPDHKTIITLGKLSNINGPWVAIFSTEEAQEHARQRQKLESHICNPTTVSIGRLLEIAPQWSIGVALDPFSAHASAIPWQFLKTEREHFDRLSLWQPTPQLSQEQVYFAEWDPRLKKQLQEWLKKEAGIAQIVIGVMGENSNDSQITAIVDCVPSVFESCRVSLRKIFSLNSKTLPIDNLLVEVKHCCDTLTIDKLVARGAHRFCRE